jgi:hypothetical protein
MRLFNIRYTKNGGMRFLRIGRFQFSFCLCNAERTAQLFAPRAHLIGYAAVASALGLD